MTIFLTKIRIIFTSILGISGVEAAQNFIPSGDEVTKYANAVVQIIIGIVTLYKLLKADKKKEEEK